MVHQHCSVTGAHRVELDSVDERILVDRPGVRGALTQCLAVRLTGSSDVLPGYRRERNQLDAVDLDLTRPDPIAAALLDSWTLPQSDGERDVPREDVVAQLAAELHARTLAGDLAARARRRGRVADPSPQRARSAMGSDS